MPRDGDLVVKQTKTAHKAGRTLQILLKLAQHLPVGSITINGPDGKAHRFEGDETGPAAILNIHNERCIRRFMTGGILGFNEAYLDGDWSSPDVAGLFEFALVNEKAMKTILRGKAWYRFLAGISHFLRPNTKRGAKKNISAHYDLGNDFYELWLDETMTYSSALFTDPNSRPRDEDLVEAQARKYENLAQQLRIKPGMHILEIGCGWGGFAEHVAKNHQARVTCITISREQFDYAKKRMADAGLDHLVEIRFQDYRDVTEKFDAIASIEMFEAVGEAYWPRFFNQVRERLKPGARAALQIITIEDERFKHYRQNADYIQKYIFPGGMLPSPTALNQQVEAAGMRIDEQLNFGRSYAETLARWNIEFQRQWPAIRHMGFDDRFKRMWEQYLAYCEAGFETGAIDVVQVALVKQ